MTMLQKMERQRTDNRERLRQETCWQLREVLSQTLSCFRNARRVWRVADFVNWQARLEDATKGENFGCVSRVINQE